MPVSSPVNTFKILRNGACLLAPAFLGACGQNTPAPRPKPATPIMATSNGGSANERKMAALIRSHPKQKRKTMIWDSRLHAAAQSRARDMGKRGYFNHVDPDGCGPNWYVTRTGYRLPIQWTAFKGANQVESILAGIQDAQPAFERWLKTSKHNSHLLAVNPFYQVHTRFGIGHVFVPGSKHQHYWVFISAPPER